MNKTYTNGIHDGYEIGGGNIIIHSNYDNKRWALTIKSAGIFQEDMCDKTCTQEEIARYINLKIRIKIDNLERAQQMVIPFI